MTKLEAVAKLLRTIHEAPVAALDTGTSSVAGLAETYLDEWDKMIQSEGWVENTEYDIDLEGADTTKLVVSVSTGIWATADMTLAQAGAFSAYTWAYGDELYVTGGTGVTAGWKRIASKVNANQIIMAEAISTASAALDIAANKIGWEDGIAVASDILKIDGDEEDALEDVVIRGGMLYDRANDTFDFSDGLTVVRVRQIPFASLSLPLQRYIVATASIEFQRRMTGGTIDDSFLREEFVEARHKCYKAEAEQQDVNLGELDMGQEILGTGYTVNPSRR